MDTVALLKQLEINYKLISNDLDFASHRLEGHLEDAARADSSIPNLHALQSRIQGLQAAMPSLVADSADVVRLRQEEEPALNASLIDSHKVMVGLYARLGVIPDPDWVAIAREVESLVRAPIHRAREEGGPVGCGRVAEEVSGAKSAEKTGAGDLGASRIEDERHRPASQPGVIFEEDFMAVAANTRGRCKLHDVRKVYAKIQEDYEKKASNGRPSHKPKPISKKMLDRAGLKVFGLTGDSILNTLRAMGLITVTKNGVTLAPSA